MGRGFNTGNDIIDGPEIMFFLPSYFAKKV